MYDIEYINNYKLIVFDKRRIFKLFEHVFICDTNQEAILRASAFISTYAEMLNCNLYMDLQIAKFKDELLSLEFLEERKKLVNEYSDVFPIFRDSLPRNLYYPYG